MTFATAYEKASKLYNDRLVKDISHQYHKELDQISLPWKKKRDLQNKLLDLQSEKLRLFTEQCFPYQLDGYQENLIVMLKEIQEKKMENIAKEVQKDLIAKARSKYYEMEMNCRDNYNHAGGLLKYRQDLEDLEMKYKMETEEFDEYEQRSAFYAFKKSIKQERFQVESLSKKREEEERLEKLRKTIQEDMKAEYDKRMQEMDTEKREQIQQKFKQMQQNYEEAMGLQYLKRNTFWGKLKLLFSG